MALTVNTNVASLTVQKNLNNAADALTESMKRLSSGLRINSAKDDAAGLQIATRMTSQIRGQSAAIKNANDGISVAQTAEGALQATTNILQRMRQLGLQARNGTNGDVPREKLSKEFADLSDEVTRIAKSTNLNGINLLDGTAGTITLQVGSDIGAANHIEMTLNKSFDALTLKVDKDSINIRDNRPTAGAVSANPPGTQTPPVDEASPGDQAPPVDEASPGDQAPPVDEASPGDQAPPLDEASPGDQAPPAPATGSNTNTNTNIDDAIAAIDAALLIINDTIASLGASQNRLDSAVSNLQNMYQNTNAALGRIQDSDFAAETAELTKQQTLQQASTAILAQANQLPAAVLKLLQ